MHRGVEFAGENSLANLAHERAALAAMRQQLAGLVGIAGGFELDDLDGDIRRDQRQPPGDLLGLGERHGALARADPHLSHDWPSLYANRFPSRIKCGTGFRSKTLYRASSR